MEDGGWRIDVFFMNRPQNRDEDLLFDLPEAKKRSGSVPHSGLAWRHHKSVVF